MMDYLADIATDTGLGYVLIILIFLLLLSCIKRKCKWDKDEHESMYDYTGYRRNHCYDCEKRIMPIDDDAGICISCGGRNRLVK